MTPIYVRIIWNVLKCIQLKQYIFVIFREQLASYLVGEIADAEKKSKCAVKKK